MKLLDCLSKYSTCCPKDRSHRLRAVFLCALALSRLANRPGELVSLEGVVVRASRLSINERVNLRLERVVSLEQVQFRCKARSVSCEELIEMERKPLTFNCTRATDKQARRSGVHVTELERVTIADDLELKEMNLVRTSTRS